MDIGGEVEDNEVMLMVASDLHRRTRISDVTWRRLFLVAESIGLTRPVLTVSNRRASRSA